MSIPACRCIHWSVGYGCCKKRLSKKDEAMPIRMFKPWLLDGKYYCLCVCHKNGKPQQPCDKCVCWNTVNMPDVVSYSAVQPIADNDTVNNPKHYNSSKARCECGRQLECIDVVRYLSFNLGNTIKYLWRFEHKNGLEDLKKARWYLDDEIKRREKES